MKKLIIAAGVVLVAALVWMRFPSPVATPPAKPVATAPAATRVAKTEQPAPPSLTAQQFDVLLTRIEKLDGKLDTATRDARDAGAKSVNDARLMIEARIADLEARLGRIETTLATATANRKWTTTTTAAAPKAKAPK
jgi:hypothetical protein